ncbi:hypothetical protein [Lichenicoccus sp.]|uniref:hypothetical protein n=1 Tax=Lichenicoccus sp. TaxID=2781899 RepID=UPI003D095F41
MVKAGQTAAPTPPAPGLIDGRFAVLPGRPSGLLGGVPAFGAEDRRGLIADVIALQVQRGAPCRARLASTMPVRHESLLSPIAHGSLGSDTWIITTMPQGAALTSLVSPWTGNALLTHVLRPAAAALDRLHAAGLTHRAIRPDNVFLAPAGRPILLGPGWASPPAMHQPSACEAPESSVCAANARGHGTCADDVYALGVLLLALWRQRMPLAGLSGQDVLRRKLELGSYAALVEDARLPQGFQEILRAMLAEQPAARPTAASLTSLDGIHERRVIRRTMLRASRPIVVQDRTVWNCRSLALACAEQPAAALNLLRQGLLEQWLRRHAEDAILSGNIEELRRLDGSVEGRTAFTDDTAMMRLVALLDPDAPLSWRGTWLWPDGLGGLLAGMLAQPALIDRRAAALLVEALLTREIVPRWLSLQMDRPHHLLAAIPPRLAREAQVLDAEGLCLLALYLLNPLLPCAAPLCNKTAAATSADVILVLEAAAPAIVAGPAAATPGPARPMMDAEIFAFLAARADDGVPEPRSLADAGSDLRDLVALARCQRQAGCGPLPRLATSLLPATLPRLQDWPGTSRRERRMLLLRAASARGDLHAMLDLVIDQAEREHDIAARERAVQQAILLSQSLNDEAAATPRRQAASRKTAQETAAAAGLVCIMGMLLFEILS